MGIHTHPCPTFRYSLCHKSPKRNPDDKPVEMLFSNIQLIILDNSNDADVATTQKRLSAHLQRRNRRKERWVHIAYLPDSHNL
jgi:hypothetical protein